MNITTRAKKPHTELAMASEKTAYDVARVRDTKKQTKDFADERARHGERSGSGVSQHRKPALTHR